MSAPRKLGGRSAIQGLIRRPYTTSCGCIIRATCGWGGYELHIEHCAKHAGKRKAARHRGEAGE